MKFIWFHLMSYPGLPPDFTSRYGSVWVDIDPSLFDAEVAHVAFNEYIDQLQLAAELGFDGIGLNEHHSNGYGMMVSPNVVAGALARSSGNAALVILGDSVALYNPPLRVAEELALLDCITGGRVIAGFPVGSPMDAVFAYGQNPALLREKYYESVAFIKKAWTADKVFSFNGNYTKLRYVNCWPRPVQKPHPPIWIPGGSSVDTWDYCIENDSVYLFLSYFGYQAAERVMHGYWSKVRELRREPNPFSAGFVQFVGVAETEKEALEIYREPAEYFFNRSLHIHPRFADPPGYKSVKTVRAGLEGMVERAAREASARVETPGNAGVTLSARTFNALTFDTMVEKGYVVVGSPDQVAEKLAHVARTLNVGRLITLCHFGNMKHEVATMNTRLMATRVLPQIRSMFDNEWEDRWWIRPTGTAGRGDSVAQQAATQSVTG